MNIRNYRQLRVFARERLDAAPAYGRIVMIFAGIVLGLCGVMTLADLAISLQMDKNGGLSGMGNRATLAAIQNVLPIVQTFVTLCLEIGYLAAILRVARGQYVSPNTLRLGFDRLWVLVRLSLIKGLIFMGLGIGTLYASVLIFMLTPLSRPVMELLTPMVEGASILGSGSMVLDDASILAVSQALTPAMVIWAVVFALLAIPLLYRFRLDQYIIIDKPGIGAVAALRESRKLMRGNCISFFLLDVKQWYYYLAMAIASAVSYGSERLAALGLELPLPGIAVYLIFLALYLALTFLAYRFLRGQVETVYALAYDSIRPEEKQDGAVLGNIFRM